MDLRFPRMSDVSGLLTWLGILVFLDKALSPLPHHLINRGHYHHILSNDCSAWDTPTIPVAETVQMEPPGNQSILLVTSPQLARQA